MARVTYVSRDQVEEPARSIYESAEQKMGLVINFSKALAHNGHVLQGFMNLTGALARSELSPVLRELAFLKASELNGCDYCRHYHHAAGRKAGLSERQVNDLEEFETSDCYDDRQRAAIRFAEQVTRHVRADDHVIAELKQFLSDRELVELTATVALANFTNRVAVTLDVGLP